MAAPHKCESCFEMTTAERWVCEECHRAGLATAREMQVAGGNMAEVQGAYAQGCAEHAAEVRSRKYAARAMPMPATGAGAMFSPVPAARPR